MNDKGGDAKNSTLKLTLPGLSDISITDSMKQATMSSRRAVAVVRGGQARGSGDRLSQPGDRHARNEGGADSAAPSHSFNRNTQSKMGDLTRKEREARLEALSAFTTSIQTSKPSHGSHSNDASSPSEEWPQPPHGKEDLISDRHKAQRKDAPPKEASIKAAEKEEEKILKNKEFKVKKRQVRDSWREVEDQLDWYKVEVIEGEAEQASVVAEVIMPPSADLPVRRPTTKRPTTKKRRRQAPANTQSSDKKSKLVTITGNITAQELASKMAIKQDKLSKAMRKSGLDPAAILCPDEAAIIASEFGFDFKIMLDDDILNIFNVDKDGPSSQPRPPVVTIMGHVDHGKTSLLDAMRNSNVVAGEAGGITQHIGAYQVKTSGGRLITFIDTPGHEAFTKMRSRGVCATDIVVLVVAADDGIMPQTVEAINHCKSASVPMILAINKIDKPGANPQKVISSISQHDVIDESLGGDVISVQISATQKMNLDKLEEAIMLVADMMELKAGYDGDARGIVLEAKLDKQRGIGTSLLVQSGSLHKGDILVAGTNICKVKNIIDYRGESIMKATPSMPVEILGFNSVPQAGDRFVAVHSEHEARNIVEKLKALQQQEAQNKAAAEQQPSNLTLFFNKSRLAEANFVVKADTDGSAQVISDYICKIQNDELSINVVHSGVGRVTESDVTLAQISKATIIAFNLSSDPAIMRLAQEKGLLIMNYNVIYHLFDDIRAKLALLLSPILHEEIIGTATVKQTFDLDRIGTIAGCLVTSGSLKRNANIKLRRNDIVVYNGKITTLKHYKDNVAEVKSGMECGVAFSRWEDIEAGDIVEAYEIIEEKKKI